MFSFRLRRCAVTSARQSQSTCIMISCQRSAVYAVPVSSDADRAHDNLPTRVVRHVPSQGTADRCVTPGYTHPLNSLASVFGLPRPSRETFKEPFDPGTRLFRHERFVRTCHAQGFKEVRGRSRTRSAPLRGGGCNVLLHRRPHVATASS